MVSGRTGYPALLRKIYEIPAARPKIHLSQGLTPALAPGIPQKKALSEKKRANICSLSDASLPDVLAGGTRWRPWPKGIVGPGPINLCNEGEQDRGVLTPDAGTETSLKGYFHDR